jgi:cytochrome c biogenesis protein CcdA
LVYCSKCGTENKEDTGYCIECGKILYPIKSREKDEDVCFGRTERELEDECFGIPYGGALVGLIIGIFIIIIGLAIALKLEIWRWIGTFILIIVGLIIIIGAFYGFRRR